MPTFLPLEVESSNPLPRELQGYVSIRSQGGESSFSAEIKKFPKTARAYRGKKSDREQARKTVESIGFKIHAETLLGMAVSGPPAAFEEISGGKLVTVERLMHAEMGRRRYISHVDIVGTKQPSACGQGSIKSKSARLEGVLVERPMMRAYPVNADTHYM